MRDNLIPILFFLFMVINIYLDKTKRKKRREKRRRQEELPQELPTEMQQRPMPSGQPDLAAEFERRLQKTTVPDVKAALHLSDAELGGLLFGAPLGQLAAIVPSAWYIQNIRACLRLTYRNKILL